MEEFKSQMKMVWIGLKFDLFCMIFEDGTWEDNFHKKHNTKLVWK